MTIKAKAKTKAKTSRPVATPESDSGAAVKTKGRNRIEEIRAKRQARSSHNVDGFSQRLSVPEELKDPDWTYRWVNDTASRVHDLEARDWEPVTNEQLAKDDRNVGHGTSVQRIGSARTVTTPENMVLMRKPKEFFEEDKAKEQDRIKENERGLMAGEVSDPNGLQGEHAYIPAGGMSIKSGNK